MITLKKRLKECNTDLDKTKKENDMLKNQLIAQINLLAKQNNTQNVILSKDFEKLLGVEKATNIENQDETEKKSEEDVENISVARKEFEERKKFLKGFEKFALTYLSEELKVDKTKIFNDIQFKEGMIGVDPIMERNIRFDAYFTENNYEYFIEIKSQLASYSPSIFTIYYMLNKIYFYKNATNKNAKLILILPVVDNSLLRSRTNSEEDLENIKNMFMPAINNNLLDIKPIYINKDLYKNIIEKQ